MRILETKRLFLRTFQEKDVESLIAINQDPKVMQFFPAIPTREETIAFIDKIISHQEEKTFPYMLLKLKILVK